LVLIFTLSSIFITIGLWAFAPWGFKFYCRPKLIYSNLTFSLNVALSGFLNQGSKALVTVFLNGRFGVADLGLYSRADSIMNLISQTLDKVVQRVSFPLISKEYHGSHNDAFRLHIRISVTLVLIIVPLAYLIGSYPKSVVFILYGPKWEESVPILEKLIYIGICVPLISQNLTLLKSVGLAGIVTENKIVALILLCFLYFFIDTPDIDSFLSILIYYTLGLYLLSLVSLLSLGVKQLFSYIRYMVTAGSVLLGIIVFHRMALAIPIQNLYHDLLLNGVTFLVFISVIYYVLFLLFSQEEQR
jgi:O-antigen/teichoic acid export membrane protein